MDNLEINKLMKIYKNQILNEDIEKPVLIEEAKRVTDFVCMSFNLDNGITITGGALKKILHEASGAYLCSEEICKDFKSSKEKLEDFGFFQAGFETVLDSAQILGLTSEQNFKNYMEIVAIDSKLYYQEMDSRLKLAFRLQLVRQGYDAKPKRHYNFTEDESES